MMSLHQALCPQQGLALCEALLNDIIGVLQMFPVVLVKL